MKRIKTIALFVAMMMLLGSFAACSKKSDKKDKKDDEEIEEDEDDEDDEDSDDEDDEDSDDEDEDSDDDDSDDEDEDSDDEDDEDSDESDTTDEEEPTDTVIVDYSDATGDYIATIDVTSFVSDNVGVELEGELVMELGLVLNADNTFTMSADMEKYYNDAIDFLSNNILTIMTASTGMDEETLKAAIVASGQYESWEEFEDQMIETLSASLDEGMDTEYMEKSGKWSIDGNTVSFAKEDGEDVFDGQYDGESITIDTGDMYSDSEFALDELVFKRV